MKIVISGAAGFIGRPLVARLARELHQVYTLGRRTNIRFDSLPVATSYWDPMAGEPPAEVLAGSDAVIHLAGEPVAQRWTASAKEAIRESRSRGTRHLVQAFSTISRRPAVLVCASAIGIYGSRGDEILTESSAPGQGFLPEVCVEWEKQASLAESLGIRVVHLRSGIVLGKGGGALQRMLPPFKAFVGGKLGSGTQWMSWIHIDDVVGLICHAIHNTMAGPVNATAPNPVRNSEFTGKLASALGRPALLPVPAFALKTLLGEMSEIVLASQRVLPRAAQSAGYAFRFPELAAALQDLV